MKAFSKNQKVLIFEPDFEQNLGRDFLAQNFWPKILDEILKNFFPNSLIFFIKKACLCQVPKAVRKQPLPPEGCNYCGCSGECLFVYFNEKNNYFMKKIKKDAIQRIPDSRKNGSTVLPAVKNPPITKLVIYK